MSSADQYRAFARECIRWANGATNLEHREAFLDMATHWAAAAARLDHQQALFDQFDDPVQAAKRQLGAERTKSSANGEIEQSHRSLIRTKSQEASLYREFAPRAIPTTGG